MVSGTRSQDVITSWMICQMVEIMATMVITHRCWDRMFLQMQMEIN